MRWRPAGCGVGIRDFCIKFPDRFESRPHYSRVKERRTAWKRFRPEFDVSLLQAAYGFANETDHRKIEPKYLESVEFRVHASQSPGCEMTLASKFRIDRIPAA
jgi:hypothetical protein